MPYGLIPLIGSVALTATFLCAAEASYRSKALVLALLIISFLWRYGMFLQVALSVSLMLYFAYLKARWKKS